MKIFNWVACAALTVPLWGAIPAHPGMLNYVEGQASINNEPVNSRSIGSVDVERDQILQTGQGKAEILLTPGVFLRLGDNSALRMISPGLTNTSVELLQGEALVEVADLHKENNLSVLDHGATTELQKNGLYRFDADHPEVAVIDGKAKVSEDDQSVELKKGKETDVSEPPHPVKFDRKKTDDLYNWSKVRSDYLSEASATSASAYAGNNGGWLGGGWYWNPYFSMYSYLPGDGFLYSPFGYGFYSPWGAYAAPVVGYYRGGRNFGNRGHVFGPGAISRGPVVRQPYAASRQMGASSSGRMSGMRSGGGRGR